MVEAIVEFDYTAVEADELSLKKGDILTNVTIQSGGWWQGTLAGNRGMFPDNFVKMISISDNNMKSSAHTDVTFRPKSGRRCKVLFSYQPANEDELRLNVDDIIDVIAEVEDGWWKGRLGEMVGVFPSNFVTEIVLEEPKRPRPGSRDESRRVLDSESDNERSLSASSPDSAQIYPSVTTAGPADTVADVPSLPPKPVKEQCRVLFGYEAANGDELTLQEGEIVTVLSREVQDRGWWRGELAGKVGLFPDNFVELIQATATPEEPPRKPERAAAAGTNKIRDIITRPAVKAEPPAPSKKPAVSLPGRKPDHVDGAGPSRLGRSIDSTKPPANKVATDTSYNTFDHVARSAMLTHPTASRVKPPTRRPPTGVNAAKEDETSPAAAGAPTLTNGTSTENVHHEEAIKKSWEKNKAPWMEELKLNQTKKKGVDITRIARPQSMYTEVSGVKSGSSPPTAAKSTRPMTAMAKSTAEIAGNGIPTAMSKSVGHKTDISNKTVLIAKEIKEEKLDVNELVAMVRSLQTSLDQHKEATARELHDLTQKLNDERQKRVQVELQLNKLTDLVTQV